jgi:hypothetical protein
MVALSVSQAIPAVGGEKGTIPRGIVGFGRVGGRGAHEDLLRLCGRKAHSPTATNNRMERPPLSPNRGTFDRLTDGLDPKHT